VNSIGKESFEEGSFDELFSFLALYPITYSSFFQPALLSSGNFITGSSTFFGAGYFVVF